MKTLISLLLVVASSWAFASDVKRLKIKSVDNIKLDAFIYLPDDLAKAKGIVLTIGGSGFTKAGFGGPANFSQMFAASDFIALEWNKRGILTSQNVDSTTLDKSIYDSATIENIVVDASKVLEFARKTYPHLPVFIVGGSEGSVTTTLLAEYYPQDIKAVATFGNVVVPFVQLVHMQISSIVFQDVWNDLDTNKDQSLSPAEITGFKTDLEEYSFIAKLDFAKADVTSDGKLSRDEMAKFLVNYITLENPDKDYSYKSSGVPPRYMDSIFRVAPLTNRAYNISIPVFIAQGEDDWNTPAKDVYQFQVQCQTSRLKNFSFKYYAKVGHAPSREMFSDFLSYFESFVPAK